MSMGLLIRDGNNRTILDPSTFTVRLVAEVEVRRGNLGANASLQIAVPGVTSAMFAQVSPLRAYPDSQNWIGSNLDTNQPSLSIPPDTIQCVPLVTCGDGFILLRGYNIAASVAIADVVVYVLSNG